jgi:transposase-like protein
MSTRRRHLAETKLKVVREATETSNVALVAIMYDLSSSMVSKWVRQQAVRRSSIQNEHKGKST